MKTHVLDRRLFVVLAFSLFSASPTPAQPVVICSGAAAGGYAAFPDICKLPSGDLYCVFYSGYAHVSSPNAQWPKGGRIMAMRSGDNGQSWSRPDVIIDTERDDRDPSIACLGDGTLLVSWFTPRHELKGKERLAIHFSRSTNQGKTWTPPETLQLDSPYAFATSTPVRPLADGSLILGLYHGDSNNKLGFGATVKSYDGGKSWKDLALIGEKDGVYLDAETDVIALKGGKLLAALRSSKVDMHYSTSEDRGKTWSPVQSLGFKGHCPYFLRHSNGMILLGHRVPATALHWSTDEGKSWHGPLQIDTVIGAYPSMLELPDGLVYCVYYEEGQGSGIRAARLRVSGNEVRVERNEK